MERRHHGSIEVTFTAAKANINRIARRMESTAQPAGNKHRAARR
jgi:hypothetical protein